MPYDYSKPVRLFSELDSGSTKTKQGSKYGGETGIRAIEKKSAGFFAKIFGKELQVGGEAYIVSRQSLKAFVARNAALFGCDSEKAAKGIKIDIALKKLKTISEEVKEILGKTDVSEADIGILCRDVFKLDEPSITTILETKHKRFQELPTLQWVDVVEILHQCHENLDMSATPSALRVVLSNLGPDAETKEYDSRDLKHALANISSEVVLNEPSLTLAKSLTESQQEEQAKLEKVYRVFIEGSADLETIQYLCSDILLLDKTTTENIMEKCKGVAQDGTVLLEDVATSVLEYQSEILAKSPKDYTRTMIEYFKYLTSKELPPDGTSSIKLHHQFASALGKMLGGVKVAAEVLWHYPGPSEKAKALRGSLNRQLQNDAKTSPPEDLRQMKIRRIGTYTLNTAQVKQACKQLSKNNFNEKANEFFAALDKNSKFLLLEELLKRRSSSATTYAEKFWESVPKKEWGPYIELLQEQDNRDLLPPFHLL